MTEFLPLCDVLFNVISLAGYFCDVVFDVVLGYALYERQKFAYFAAVIVIVLFSLVISQIVSIRWYLNKRKIRNATTSTTGPPGAQDAETGPNAPGSTSGSLEKKKKKPNSLNAANGSGVAGRTEEPDGRPGAGSRKSEYSRYIVLALHVTQLGVLWRYAKLFVPVDLRHVKHEVRDLCMLRLVHAFCEAAPMLLLQLYVLVTLQSEAQLAATLKLKTLGHHHHLPASTALVQQTNLAEQQQKTFRDLNMVSATLSLFSVCWALASFSKNVRLQNVHRLVLTWLGVIFQFLWRLGTVISRVISLTVYASVYSHWVFLVIILHWFSMFLWLISPKNVFHGERISRLKKTTLGGLIAFVYIFAYINLQEVRHRQKMLTFYVVMFAENCLLVCLWMVGVWPNRPEGWYLVPVSVLCSFAAGLFFMVVYYRYFHVRRLGYEAGGRISEKCSGHCGTDGCRCLAGHDNGIDGMGISGGGGYKGAGGIGGGLSGMNGVGGQKYPHAIPGVFNCRFSNPQKLQEKKQKQLAELKIIEEEIKQGKLGGPGGTGTLSSGDDGKTTLPRQPIPRAKKHIDLDPIEWRTSSPDMAEIVANKSFNDLNLLLAANLDDVNSLNKFNSNYDPIYNSFGLNGINISALVNLKGGAAGGPAGGMVDAGGQSSSVPVGPVVGTGNRNMSPISSQISATESNSLTRQVMPRSKILPNNIPRNPFAENYRGNFVNLYADAAASTPAGLINGAASGNGGVRAPSISPRTTEIAQSNRAILYDAHGRLYTDANHPRQVSGTYSSTENAGAENLPFPYNVVPPPRSKLDSRGTPTTPVPSGSASGSANNTNSSNKSGRTATTATMAAIVASVGAAGGSSSGVGSGGAAGVINNLNNTKRQNMQRAKTPEILLAPHYLENSRIYFDWVAREAANFRLQESERDQPMESSGDENLDNSGCDDGHNGHHRIPSDIDSQVSLPRSYTLPREFKYYRRNKGRKVKNEHFIASTNSSDGDVDSGDDNESERLSNLSSSSQRRVKNATPCTNLTNGHHGPVLQQQQQQSHHLQQPLPRQRLNNLNKSVAQTQPPISSASMALMYAGGSGGSPSGTLLLANGQTIPPVNSCRQTLNATPQNLHQQLPHASVPLANGYNLTGGGDRSSPAMPALLSGSDGSPVGLVSKPGAVHSFDLISGVEAVGAGLPPYHPGSAGNGAVTRPTRFRMYGTKNGMNTKEANQEDTSQQSGLATVESEYDTASDSPSDGGEEEDEEEDYEEEESGGEEEEDEDDDEGTDEEDDGTEEEDDEDDVIEVLERQSGDGQEQDADSRRKVDDDEDRSNPQYIPKKGTFYEHDDRTAEDDLNDSGLDGDGDQRSKRNDDGLGDGLGDSHGGGGGGPGSGGGGGGGGLGAPGMYGGERRGSEKGGSGVGAKGTKKWQASTDRWTHDRFDESEQAPKSQAELVFAYGYDIRSEDGPPKARRKRRYARGPNRYTRNWEDEDAYQKSSNAEHHQRHKKVPRPEEFPELAGANGKSGRATGRGRNGQKSGSSTTGGPDQRRQSGATDAGRNKSSDVRRSAGQDRSMGRSERVRSGDWSGGAGGGDRAREPDRGADWDRSEYGGGGSLRYRNEDRGSRNNYHNKENKLSGPRNSKEKDYKVINSLQFKNQARNKTMEGGSGGNGGGAPVTGPIPGSGPGSGLSDGNPGGAPMMHSSSAGALSGSSNSNKMNNHGTVQQHSGGSSTNAGGVSNERIHHSESNQQQGRMVNVVTTSASLGSVPSAGSQQHYGHHASSMGQMQQHSHQQPQQPTQKLKQGYLEEDHSKYAVPLYAGSSPMDRMQPNQPPPPAQGGPGGQNPPQVQYHQATTLYYTAAGAAGGPSPGDYVTQAAPGGQPQQQPPQQPTQAPPQAQYAPPPYATQGPPPQPPQAAPYMQGPVPTPSAYLPAPQPANVSTVPQPPTGVPGGAPPPPMNFVPALGPPPTAPAPPGVSPGQYPGPAAYATGFQTGYAPAVGVVPQAVPGGPPPPSVVTGPGGPPPTALYQPSGGITYYAPQTQTQAPRPLPTGRRPTAAIPILAPPERKPAVTSTTTPSTATNKTSSTRPATTTAGDTNESPAADASTGAASSVVDASTPSGTTATVDSGENIDHILDNMFVQRPQYQPPSRKSPSPALAPSAATQQPQSQAAGNETANGATELRTDGGSAVVDGQDSMDNIGESVKKMSIQDTDKLSIAGSLAAVDSKELVAGGGVIDTNTTSQPVE
uniref:XK-related protein n=1 Tax=Anopheles culicifacies TaxID=139723 RepID=A0A182MRU4_9DIPT